MEVAGTVVVPTAIVDPEVHGHDRGGRGAEPPARLPNGVVQQRQHCGERAKLMGWCPDARASAELHRALTYDGVAADWETRAIGAASEESIGDFQITILVQKARNPGRS